MKETSPDQPHTDHIRFPKAHGGPRSTSRRPDATRLSIISNPGTASPAQLQLQSQVASTGSGHDSSSSSSGSSSNHGTHGSTPIPVHLSLRGGGGGGGGDDGLGAKESKAKILGGGLFGASRRSPPAASAQDEGQGSVLEQPANDDEKKKPTVLTGIYLTVKKILLHTWLNVLLVFVPLGIVVKCVPGMSPGVVFAMNAIAIIPLAGLLGYATESVAHKMGDSIGALLNITFGNAVELIIFIALVKNEIRIVQASLLGSILANLLLILGMGFLLGGLRFREQIYNSTVTQMSACLLSLSVISLVLPTAFHASFNDQDLADTQSLKISRGTSVILLLVYVIYLMFQLKSHAYMYESTPQHIIDEESTPGPAAAWLDSSSSSDSSSSDSDSDNSSHSRDTVSKRMRRVIRGGRRRKSSVASQETAEVAPTRTPSFGTTNVSPSTDEPPSEESSARPALLPRLTTFAEGSYEEAVEEEKPHRHRKRRHRHSLRRYRKNKKKSSHLGSSDRVTGEETIEENPETMEKQEPDRDTRRVDFAISNSPIMSNDEAMADAASSRRPFNLRGMSFKPVAKSLAPTVFTRPPDIPAMPVVPTGPIPRVRYGIRRTNSLPDRLNQYQFRPPGAMLPSQIPMAALANAAAGTTDKEDTGNLSRKASIIMLLITTGLVAVCAEFMVDSINGLVATNAVGEIFIGLIILPIVGNAAEHVTAVMVAMKNKMDLAIGVAVGSSIQIALFITPLVVILGWIIGRDMTLYFTLFETVCLFVSAFIVNFLVLDGRSNYLEGALLCATYVIIGLVAFYYPAVSDTSQWGH